MLAQGSGGPTQMPTSGIIPNNALQLALGPVHKQHSAMVELTNGPQLNELSPDRLDHLSDRFAAIISILVTINYILTPLMWFEAPHSAQRITKLATPLMRNFGFLVQRCGPRPRILAWMLFVTATFSAPILVTLWLYVAAQGQYGFNWRHLPAGIYNVVQCFILTLGLTAFFTRTADFANELALQFAKEVKAGKMSAPRLRAFRTSWLHLLRYTQNQCPMPITICIYMIILITMSTFFTFQFLVVVRVGSDPQLTMVILCIAILWDVSAIVLCSAAQRVSDTVKMKFDRILRVDFHLSYPRVNPEMQRELKFFAHITSRGDVRIPVAGFFYLQNKTVTSISTAIFSYLIVLLQFQSSDKFYR
ncbi:Gustatory and odorant receptor 63a [Frankliniella fusca]|uniref:Gustatory receptor n=1 Tax=Frankliniella fusca TaxID=407009 RepID=A0AAE1HZT2_9NEOP|nr:Gustatory and odorant receptor 63a [Frankliniella fusca]